MRKEQNYETKILVKFVKKNLGFQNFYRKQKPWSGGQNAKKYRVTEKGLLLHPVRNSRDLESKMRKMNDVKHDNFGQTGRN